MGLFSYCSSTILFFSWEWRASISVSHQISTSLRMRNYCSANRTWLQLITITFQVAVDLPLRETWRRELWIGDFRKGILKELDYKRYAWWGESFPHEVRMKSPLTRDFQASTPYHGSPGTFRQGCVSLLSLYDIPFLVCKENKKSEERITACGSHIQNYNVQRMSFVTISLHADENLV